METKALDTVKALIACASTDQTRFHLNGVHYDGEYFVSTDGHRLIAVKVDASPIAHHLQVSQIKPGDILETKAFKVGGITRIDGRYPAWKQLIPDLKNTKWTFRLVVPAWLENVKQKARAESLMIGIDELGNLTSGKALIYLNPAYLAPFAGQFVDISINDETSPIHISPVDGSPMPWKAVIMPMRGGNVEKVAPVVLKAPKVETHIGGSLRSEVAKAIGGFQVVKS